LVILVDILQFLSWNSDLIVNRIFILKKRDRVSTCDLFYSDTTKLSFTLSNGLRLNFDNYIFDRRPFR
jgi:hypothetical protein